MWRFAAAMPEPKGRLEYVNNFTLLVAVVPLCIGHRRRRQQSHPRLVRGRRHAAKRCLALGEAGLSKKIKTIGLYRRQGQNVIALSRALIHDHAGQTPGGAIALEALPGVRRKTANVVLNIAFGAETIAVDTHVFRFQTEFPSPKAKTPPRSRLRA